MFGAQPDYLLAVPDTDGVEAKAVAVGVTLRAETREFVSGDLFASISDPFGVRQFRTAPSEIASLM